LSKGNLVKHINSRHWGIVLALLLAGVVACDQSFDPSASGTAAPIVYAIISTEKADQYVRIYTTYPRGAKPSTNSSEYPVTDANVFLGGFPLTLTTLARVDSSRYTTPIYAYRTSGFTPQYGNFYSLNISTAAFGNLSASIVLPSKPTMQMNQRSILQYPNTYDPSAKLTMNATITGGAEAFLFRLLVCYDVLEENGWVRKRTEIPARFKSDPPTLESALYGEVTRVQTPSVANGYTAYLYQSVLGSVYEQTKPYKVIFNYVVLQFVQLEKNLYNYYSSVKGFEDPFSIRLDQANFSNIKNGSGIFAGYTVDSLVQILPADFSYNRR